jgi:hypothetical protein
MIITTSRTVKCMVPICMADTRNAWFSLTNVSCGYNCMVHSKVLHTGRTASNLVSCCHSLFIYTLILVADKGGSC